MRLGTGSDLSLIHTSALIGPEEAGRSNFALLSFTVFRYCCPDYLMPYLGECFNSSRFEVDPPTANSANSSFLLALQTVVDGSD
jgi:hypothetical protein